MAAPSQRKTTAEPRAAWLLAALFVFTASLCLLTYGGGIETGDSLRLFDGVSSAANYRDVLLDQSAAQFMPSVFDESIVLPLAPAAVEPGQIVAAVPLHWLGTLIPWLGQVHVVWLFNIIIAALIVCLFFGYARLLGYGAWTSWLAAVVLAIGTSIWVYSQTFFREPLTALLLLLTAYLLDRLRRNQFRSGTLIACVVLSTLAMLLTRASAALALPALLLIALPPLRDLLRRQWSRIALVILLVLAAAAVVFIIIGTSNLLPDFSSRYAVFDRLRTIDTRFLGYAVSAYLISPGGSIWGTSPVLLLALPGAILLARRGESRYVWVAIALVAVMALGYALLNGSSWFGGLSWPPRFLVPAVPVLMLLTLPLFERATSRPASLVSLVIVALAAYGVWIQLNGLFVPWSAYSAALPPESGGNLEWAGGLYDPRWFRWVLGSSLWSASVSSLAWVRFNQTGALISFGLVAAASIGFAIASQRLSRKLFGRLAMAVLFTSLLLITGYWLSRLYVVDDRYRTYDTTLSAMVEAIATQTDPDDVILLSGTSLQPFFLNSDDRMSGGRVVALPFQPGERPSPEQPAQVTGDNPLALLTAESIRLIQNLALTHERLFLLVDGGPDLWWSTRPVERYMNSAFFPVQTIATGPITRLIEYDTTSAPDPFYEDTPGYSTDLVFGEQLRLLGFDLSTTSVAPGAVIPVSLVWQAVDLIPVNLTAAIYLRAADGGPITQSDALPGGGFPGTADWPINSLHRDHRGLRIPSGTPPGSYQLWVKVYRFDDSGSPQDLETAGRDALDDVIGVLPIQITVADPGPLPR